jgi:uncharacterized 2Fe-2S/4Fe-4S cluster protein (DUF4445 family)
LDVSPLGSYPYNIPQHIFEPLAAEAVGLHLPSAPVFLLPVVSAYIGGDIAGALALADLMYPGVNMFFVDIGTNGEMFLKDSSGTVHAVSCAMGPALEGMNISMGMTASSGAVTHAGIENGAQKPQICLQILGAHEKPAGFAGTGIIDMIAIMLQSGIIRKDGAFSKDEGAVFGNAALADDGFCIDDKLVITQKDVRAIQLAKAACLAGAAILLEEAAVAAQDVELAVIAGSLGSNLNVQNFEALGFLPRFGNAKVLLPGNTSLAAAQRCCFDTDFYSKIAKLCGSESVRVIDAASHPRFNDLFMEAISF